MPKQFRGTVSELPSKENGWFLEVTREDGELVYLTGFGGGSARSSTVGDVGTLRYLTTASAGWWSWVKG